MEAVKNLAWMQIWLNGEGNNWDGRTIYEETPCGVTANALDDATRRYKSAI